MDQTWMIMCLTSKKALCVDKVIDPQFREITIPVLDFRDILYTMRHDGVILKQIVHEKGDEKFLSTARNLDMSHYLAFLSLLYACQLNRRPLYSIFVFNPTKAGIFYTLLRLI